MIQTPRLILIPANLPRLEAAASNNLPELSALLGGVKIEPDWTSFPDAIVWMRDFLREFPADINWWNYMTIHRTDKKLIGACGFKGEPDLEGMVELGYAPGCSDASISPSPARKQTSKTVKYGPGAKTGRRIYPDQAVTTELYVPNGVGL